MTAAQDRVFNEWVVKVHEELVILNARTEALRESVDKLNEMLTGDDAPEKGLIVRVDRLEVSEARRARLVWMAMTASCTALLGLIVRIIRD